MAAMRTLMLSFFRLLLMVVQMRTVAWIRIRTAPRVMSCMRMRLRMSLRMQIRTRMSMLGILRRRSRRVILMVPSMMRLAIMTLTMMRRLALVAHDDDAA